MHFSARAQQFYYISLCIAAFVISFPLAFGAVSVMLIILAWLLSFNARDFKHNFVHRKLLWFSIAFFALHAISYIYSTDKSQSYDDTQRKFSFFILPIAIGCGPAINKKNLEYIFTSLVAGLSVSMFVSLGKASYVWLKTGTTNQFFYHTLTDGFAANAIYFSLFFILSLSVLLLYSWEYSVLKYKALRYGIIVLQTCFLILLSSKMLLLFFIFLLVPIYLIKTRRKNLFIPRLTAIACIILAIFVISYTNNPIKTRYQDMLKNDENKAWMASDPNGKHFNSLSLRLYIWKIAYENIRDKDLWWKGCGNGDVELYQKEKLQQYYSNTNPDWNVPLWKFNLHNEYLQVLMMIGIPGLLIFLAMAFLPLYYFRRIDNGIIPVIFIMSTLFFMVQESAFEIQAGIIYYSLFLNIFWNVYYTGNKKAVVA